jgi:hypothetical protein
MLGLSGFSTIPSLPMGSISWVVAPTQRYYLPSFQRSSHRRQGTFLKQFQGDLQGLNSTAARRTTIYPAPTVS